MRDHPAFFRVIMVTRTEGQPVFSGGRRERSQCFLFSRPFLMRTHHLGRQGCTKIGRGCAFGHPPWAASARNRKKRRARYTLACVGRTKPEDLSTCTLLLVPWCILSRTEASFGHCVCPKHVGIASTRNPPRSGTAPLQDLTTKRVF